MEISRVPEIRAGLTLELTAVNAVTSGTPAGDTELR
jgi:hypothetical protein